MIFINRNQRTLFSSVLMTASYLFEAFHSLYDTGFKISAGNHDIVFNPIYTYASPASIHWSQCGTDNLLSALGSFYWRHFECYNFWMSHRCWSGTVLSMGSYQSACCSAYRWTSYWNVLGIKSDHWLKKDNDAWAQKMWNQFKDL